jgi:Taurine catabolism dioxygenase TauD, TfdA family
MNKGVMQTVQDVGWYSIPRNEKDLLYNPIKLARSLEPVKMQLDRLQPCEEGNARPNTLSSKFGLGDFPPHTDLALVDVPPSYILMHAPKPRLAKTQLFDTNDLLEAVGVDVINRSLFQVSGLRKTFYSNLVTYHKKMKFFRYNGQIMSPINQEAKVVDAYIRKKWKPWITIDWVQNKTLIFDNWLLLHGRTQCNAEDSNAALWRVSLWGCK